MGKNKFQPKKPSAGAVKKVPFKPQGGKGPMNRNQSKGPVNKNQSKANFNKNVKINQNQKSQITPSNKGKFNKNNSSQKKPFNNTQKQAVAGKKRKLEESSEDEDEESVVSFGSDSGEDSEDAQIKENLKKKMLSGMMDSDDESSDEDEGPASKRTKMATDDSESDEDDDDEDSEEEDDKPPVTKVNGKPSPVAPKEQPVIKTGKGTKDEDVILIVKQRLEEQHKRSLYVRGVPKNCTPSMLKDLAPQMTSCNIPSSNHGTKSRGYCFMEFKTPEIASSMIAKLKGKTLGSNSLIINQATAKGGDLTLEKLDLKNIYITGLVKEVKETHVKSLFPKALKVSVATLAGGICAGTAVVTFGNVNHARAAFDSCHKKVLLGNPISITYIFVHEKKPKEKKEKKKADKTVTATEKATQSTTPLKKQPETPKVTDETKKSLASAVKASAEAAKKKDESETDEDEESSDEEGAPLKKVDLDGDSSDEDSDEEDDDDDEDEDSDDDDEDDDSDEE